MKACRLLNEGRNALLEITDEYEADAWCLFEKATGFDRHKYLLNMENDIPDEICRLYREYVKKRLEHVPVQYIIGTQGFMGLEFFVNENVLIPRQDTEILVCEALKYLRGGENVLDMCTGSGCIIISIAKHVKLKSATGVDISTEALCVARKNAEKNDVEAEFVQSDLFADLSVKEYDMIISNPPYIETSELCNLMPEVSRNEPLTALDGGADGLLFYRRIISGSGNYLKRGGMLLFEVGHNQADDVCRLMNDVKTDFSFCDVGSVNDLCGIKRVVKGIKI